MLKQLVRVVLVLAVLFLIAQLVRPSIPSKPATAEIHAPENVRQILRKDCYSCHSDERRLAWFDQPEPAYFLVRKDILEAREHLNFSTLGSKPDAVQKATLYEAVNMIQLGAMPLPRFLALHKDARVTPDELATLKDYLSPWGPLPASTDTNAAPAMMPRVALDSVKPEWNGLAFEPTFATWKPISFTDRGDNHTFRFILGNDVAAKAVAEGKISPWPDGAKLAKIAWKQEANADGTLRVGDFIQVELMVKDAQKYASTEGWGWGRWRGLDLKPYGKDASFVKECTSCHLPVKGDDYVYTLPMTAATVPGTEVVNNHSVTLPTSLPYQPLAWKPMTMLSDPVKKTISVLYGNDAALQHGAGAVVALVTWAERDDPHWFGGRIPDSPVRVEFLANGADYQQFAGPQWTKVESAANFVAERKELLLSLKPASLP
ncbi:cytochrome P460 family protein [Terriglobus roseus]|uniref:Cytochrome P460 n=1 Tax=Terriglobus roseus TaxID=392734 RepID=A0A1G7HVB6_9BACT|nr:cytochrome P460 family protein [Terriglobus roseus]SDF04410.1 Cytochrome P460 [Terriglobus roseus]